MRPHLCQRLSTVVIVFFFFCLSLVQVPKSRVSRGSSFHGGGEGVGRFVPGGGERKGVVFKNLGPLGQRFSVLPTKSFTKALLESYMFLFLSFLEILAYKATQTAKCECKIAFACSFSRVQSHTQNTKQNKTK